LSPLTKVMALLVSVLSIFLCGVVVVYVANVANYKQLYEEQQGLKTTAETNAKQIQDNALAAEIRFQETIKRQNATIMSYEQLNSDWVNQWEQEHATRLSAEKERDNAVALSLSLSKTLDNMQSARDFLQNKLVESEESKLSVEAQLSKLEEDLSRQLAEVKFLQSERQMNQEEIANLEAENERLSQGGAGLASRELRPGIDQVTNLPVGQTRESIRGEVTEVRDDLAAISIGESSGVKVGQVFKVLRQKLDGTMDFMGNLTIIDVEPEEAAGRLSLLRGVVLKGDKVSTDFR